MDVNEETTLERSFEVRVAEVDDQMVLVRRNEAFEMNVVAQRAWREFDGRTALGTIAGHVCDEFDVGKETALADIIELGRTLVRLGLAEVST